MGSVGGGRTRDMEFNFNFLINPSRHLYKHTSHEIVCKGMHISILIPYYMGRAYFRKAFPKKSQYLINGESDQKSARNKRDVEFNFLY